MQSRARVLAWLVGCAAILLAAPPMCLAADVLVICPAEFRAALGPWLAHRRGQGHKVDVATTVESPEHVRAAIRAKALAGDLRHVLLVGDAPAALVAGFAPRGAALPVAKIAARVTLRYGSEAEIATDNWYADLDDDGVPDLAIGRITADTPSELKTIVGKVLAYERNVDFGHWRRRINIVAGAGGFGTVIDGALEMWARRLITDGVPAAYSTSLVYSSVSSPYCPDPRGIRPAALASLSEGCLFWVYMGHGRHDRVNAPGEEPGVLFSSDMPRLAATHGAPIALFLSCYAGAFDGQEDCLAEEMLRAPGAPIAILCGSRVTMPYAMAVLGREMLVATFQARPPTLGEAVLEAKRAMAAADRGDPSRKALDEAAAALGPSGEDLAAERLEHLALFNLIGDPLIRIPRPRDLQLDVIQTAVVGDRLTVRGESDVQGRCTVELVVCRDRLAFKPPPRDDDSRSPASLAEFQDTHRRANDQRLAWAETDARKGVFQTSLTIPPEARGRCHVRVFIEGESDCAAGAADIIILRRRPRPAAGSALRGVHKTAPGPSVRE